MKSHLGGVRYPDNESFNATVEACLKEHTAGGYTLNFAVTYAEK